MRPAAAATLFYAGLFAAFAAGPLAAGEAPKVDASQADALKDCMDKQQASNTTHLTQEQMQKACQDQLRAMKATTPSAMSKATMRRSTGPSAQRERRERRP